MKPLRKFLTWFESLVTSDPLGKIAVILGNFLSIVTLLLLTDYWSDFVTVTPRVFNANLLSYSLVLLVSLLTVIPYTLFVYALSYEAINLMAVVYWICQYLLKFARFLSQKIKSRS